MQQLRGLLAVAAFLLLTTFAIPATQLQGGPSVQSFACACRTTSSVFGGCGECEIGTVVLLQSRKAMCSRGLRLMYPNEVITEGCEPLGEICRRRVGVTLTAPCAESLTLQGAGQCETIGETFALCPNGEGTIGMFYSCGGCTIHFPGTQ